MASFTVGQRVEKLTRGGHPFAEGEYLGSVYTKQGEELCVAVRANGTCLNPAPPERWRALDDPPVRWTVAPFAVEYWVKEIERRVVVSLPGVARDALGEVLTRLLAFAGASAGRLRDALMAERERADRLRGKIDDQSHRFAEREKARVAERDALCAANAVHVARLHHQETQLGELHGELAALRAENKGAFEVGDPVLKTSGYPFPGSYRGSVWTSKGEERVIVEHDDGWLHIFNPSQIAAAEHNPAKAIEASMNRMADRMGMKFVKNERWPEVVRETSATSIATAMTEDAPDHWMLVQPSDSAPVVEVTQGDNRREIVDQVINAYHTTRLISDPVTHILNKDSVNRLFNELRTEAEARGRREALDAIEELVGDSAVWKYPREGLVAIRKRLMGGE